MNIVGLAEKLMEGDFKDFSSIYKDAMRTLREEFPDVRPRKPDLFLIWQIQREALTGCIKKLEEADALIGEDATITGSFFLAPVIIATSAKTEGFRDALAGEHYNSESLAALCRLLSGMEYEEAVDFRLWMMRETAEKSGFLINQLAECDEDVARLCVRLAPYMPVSSRSSRHFELIAFACMDDGKETMVSLLSGMEPKRAAGLLVAAAGNPASPLAVHENLKDFAAMFINAEKTGEGGAFLQSYTALCDGAAELGKLKGKELYIYTKESRASRLYDGLAELKRKWF